MHVLGFELVEFWQRLCHRLVASPTVEANGVREGVAETTIVVSPCSPARRSSSSLRCPPTPRARWALLTWRNASCAIPGRMCRVRTPMPTSCPSAKAPSAIPACVELPLALGALVGDRVLAFSLARPRWRAPVAGLLLELGAVLHVQGLDPLAAVDLADPREIRRDESPVSDVWFHLSAHGSAAPFKRGEAVRLSPLDSYRRFTISGCRPRW